MNTSTSNNFWLFLELLARRKRLIIGIVVVVTILAVVVSLLLPQWYSASALLLPPKNISISAPGAADWSEVLSVTSGLNLPVRATPSDIYVRMMKSSAVASRIIDRFDLTEKYGTGNFEETSLALMSHTDIRVTDEGLLMVSVEDRQPQVAADMANAYVEELQNVSDEIVAERISKTREFLTGRLEQVRQELDSSREALKEFQMKYKAVDFDEQTRLAVEQAISLKNQLAELEFEARVGGLTLNKDNTDLVRLDRRRNIVKNQLRQLETENADSSFFSLPVAAIPSLRGDYEILDSRVKVAEALYQVLLEQSEQAKIKEHENLPTISVLDAARVPSLRSRPQRSLIVAGSFGLSIIFAIFLAAVVEYLSRMKHTSPEDYGSLMAFIDAFFGWLPGVGKTPRTVCKQASDNTQREYDVNIDN